MQLSQKAHYHSHHGDFHMDNRQQLIDILRSHEMQLFPRFSGEKSVLNKIPGIRAILYDIYGTLFISGSGDVGISGEKARPQLFEMALSENCAFQISKDAGEVAMEAFFTLISAYHARDSIAGVDVPEVDIREIWLEVLMDLVAKNLISCAPDMDLATKTAVTYESLANPTCPMPHLNAVIDKLSKKRIVLGIISNAQVFTPLLFEAYLGKSPTDLGFAPELCAYSYVAGVAKPSSAIFQGVLANLYDKYGIKPDETIYVGNDMLNDVWAASRTGCRTCLFAGDRRSLRLRAEDQRCRDLKPDCVIVSLPEIFEII